MALTREERNARKLERNRARRAAMTIEERAAYNARMTARRRMNELYSMFVEFGYITAELRGDEYTPPDSETVEPPQGWSDEWEQVTMALRGKFA